ncbi:hypothetical protein QAD02_017739 [Eretmocerus hayati]|uniref:Uncharacterized protein n=1 Tax=Eretmocerus hayati TaxID=131215 RepID=A0ACC2PER9_9HYME|nr:hypothetical protein QAD02_017739 [Eretmocerus hayati]
MGFYSNLIVNVNRVISQVNPKDEDEEIYPHLIHNLTGEGNEHERIILGRKKTKINRERADENEYHPGLVFCYGVRSADGNYEVTLMTKATVYYSGIVVWQPPAVYKSSCSIDVEFFPYDVQTCVLKLGSWTYDGFKVPIYVERDKFSYILIAGFVFVVARQKIDRDFNF